VATPERLRDGLRRRADLYALIRRFFAERNVLEVETPILSVGANTDPNIQSFSTRFSGRGAGERWLRTSSEFAQKRLLVAGVGDCYELGRVFRDGEAGRRHNPEFTMLEWYRVKRDHRWLVGETVEFIRAALASADKPVDVLQTTYRDLFESTIGVDPFSDTVEALSEALGDVAIDPSGLSHDDWLDLLLTHRIQPKFPHDHITVVIDYPPTQCALAQVRGDVAERFEVYVGSHELANGYHELTDPAEQRRRFERDNERRRDRGLPTAPIGENLLRALERGLPDCAGVALGIERLLMAMTGSDNIADVLAFPFAEA
jgi:lysyl-tRNA synthetase class 2